MTQSAMTPGTATSMRAPGPSEGEVVACRPTRTSAGSTSDTSSCSPLRSRIEVSKRAWASTRRRGACRSARRARRCRRHAAPLRVRLK